MQRADRLAKANSIRNKMSSGTESTKVQIAA
jgi:hypothetical protein